MSSGGGVRATDLLGFAFGALAGHRLRSVLTLLGVAIGVAAVLLLTALGEGARRYVVRQFASLGTNLLVVVPGRTDTTGGIPGIGGTPKDLTLEDVQALAREIPESREIAALAMGTEEVAYRERRRQVAIVGTTASFATLRELELARGEFLPEDEAFRGSPRLVLGHTVAAELFPGEDPLGKAVRVGGWRMRVVGVLAPQGVNLGIDLDEVVIAPVATVMAMLNRSSLFRIFIQVGAHAELDAVREKVLAVLAERHREEDVTVLTQDAVISTFSTVFNALTLAVAAIAAISLAVAGIGVMNVMLVSVSERTREIGLLMALGVSSRQILAAFLAEAAILSSLGGAAGLLVGEAGVRLLVHLYPNFPAAPPAWAIAAAAIVSVGVGVTFGLLPARRATRLDPVVALGRR